MNPDNIFPYLVLGGIDSIGTGVGHGLFVLLFEDAESSVGIVHVPIGADRLAKEKLAIEDAHRIALANLSRFADESPALSIQVLGQPGDAEHFLLYSDHPRASSCLLLPDLFEHACEVLQAKELLACVPQRESLVVFSKRERPDRERLVNKLREIEADAQRPLTFELFELASGSFRPFHETFEATA